MVWSRLAKNFRASVARRPSSRLSRHKFLSGKRGPQRTLRVESLEDRALLAMLNVSSANMNGWDFNATGGTGAGAFVLGPATPPLGTGSAELSTGANGSGAIRIRNVNFAGTNLSDLTTLTYSSYTQSASYSGLHPYMQLYVDYDGNLATFEDILFFEPEYQNGYTGAVPTQADATTGVWQTWDALAGGWWSPFDTLGTSPAGAAVRPLADFVALNPTARIMNPSGTGGVRFTAGFGAPTWDNYVGNLDAFTIGVAGNNTTFDFGFQPTTTYVDDDWALLAPATIIVDADSSMPGNQSAQIGYDAFATVTEAIGAVADGGRTFVNAGTYIENLALNKSLDLEGAQVGVNPNDGSWNDTRTNPLNEATIRGSLNVSLRNVISVDGFTFERTGSNEGHILVGGGNPLGSGAASTQTISNNRFVGSRSTGTAFAGVHTNFLDDGTLPGGNITVNRNRFEISGTASGAGVLINANQPGTDGQGKAVLTDNYIASSPSNGLNINRPGAFATVTGNRLVNDDIFMFRVNHFDTANLSTVSANTIINAPQAAVGIAGGSNNVLVSGNTIINPRRQAILVADAGFSAPTPRPNADISVDGNTITVDVSLLDTTVIPPNYAFIDVRGGLDGVNDISENELTLSGVRPGAVTGLYGIRVRGTTVSGTVNNLSIGRNTLDGGNVGGLGQVAPNFPATSGLWIDTELLTAGLDLDVEENFINGWVNAATIYNAGSGTAGGLAVGANVDIHENDLSGNSGLGVSSGAGELVNASANWWGTNTAAGVAAEVTANVDYTPWLNIGTDTDLVTAGFQGDFSHLHIDDDSPQSGATDRIQEAVNLLADGVLTGGARTIQAHAGTYTLVSDITLNKSLTLLGPNAAISPVTGMRVAEAAINGAGGPLDGAGGFSFNLAAGITELTVDGLSFTGFDGNTFESSLVPVTDVTLHQNIFTGNNGGLFYKFDLSVATDFDVVDNRFENHGMTGVNQALFHLGNVADSRFNDNRATNISSRELFNIYHALTNTTFDNNELSTTGGLVGIFADASNIDITDNEILNTDPAGLPSPIMLAPNGQAITDVLIDGNTIQNVIGDSGIINLVGPTAGSSLTDLTISNNTIQGTLYGVTLDTHANGNGTIADVTIADNDFINNSFSPILAYSRTNGGGGLNSVSDLTVERNTFLANAAIYGSSFFLLDFRNIGGTNVFDENSITFSGALPGGTDAIRALAIRGSRTGTFNITQNDFDGGGVVHNNAPTVFVSGIAILANDATIGPLPATAVINITNNFINGFQDGIVIRDGVIPGGAYGNLPVGVDVNVHNNNLSGNSLFALRGGPLGETVDASANWWGTNTPAGVAAETTANVDYTPWLHFGTDTSAAAGFQGDFSHLHVDDDSPQVGAVTRINEAVALLQDGALTAGGRIIDVHAGTYAENVVINKPLMLVGAQAGNDADARFAAFVGGPNGPKADPAVEAIITAPVNNPAGGNPGANDLVRLLADDITIDGLVIDGNNPALAGASAVQFCGIDIDARRGLTTVDAAGNFIVTSGLEVRHSIVQNLAERGFNIDNDGAVPAVKHSIHDNVIRSFGESGIILFWNAYTDITNNTIDSSIADTIGVQLQNFFTTPNTMTWSGNQVTVGQDSFGIHVNLFYAPLAVLDISNNTVNAAAGVTGASDLTWGINAWSVQNDATVNITDNTVGSAGGEFARGINLWNLPTNVPVTVDGGSVGNSVVGIYLDSVDSTFGAGADTTVNVQNVAVTANSVGLRVRNVANAVNPAGDVRVNLTGGSFNAGTAAATGIEVLDGLVDTFTAALQISGSPAITGGTTGLVINGQETALIGNTLASSSFSGQSGNYVELGASTLDNVEINGLAVLFEGQTGGARNTAGNYSLEDRIVHGVDDSGRGFVRVKAGELFTTPNSFVAPAMAADLQDAIDVATTGNTLHIQGGSYTGSADVSPVDLTLSVGASPAQVILNGNLSLDEDDTLVMELNGTVAATDYDNFVVNGTVSLGNVVDGFATLSPTAGFAYAPLSYVTLIANDGMGVAADDTVGHFNGLADGDVVVIGGQNFLIFHNGGDGNDVILVKALPGITPTEVYVEDADWTDFTLGTFVDGDLSINGPGVQPAFIGYNAFNNRPITAPTTTTPIQDAVDAVLSGPLSRVIVNEGNYPENVVIADKTLVLEGRVVDAGNATINPAAGVGLSISSPNSNIHVIVRDIDVDAPTALDIVATESATIELQNFTSNNSTTGGSIVGVDNLLVYTRDDAADDIEVNFDAAGRFSSAEIASTAFSGITNFTVNTRGQSDLLSAKPTLAGQALNLHLNGGPPNFVGVPTGDSLGDKLILDMSDTTGPVVVSTLSGFANSTSHRPLTFEQIEDIDLIDDGLLTNVVMGDLYVRGTALADTFQFTQTVAGVPGVSPTQLRVRINNSFFNLLVSTRTVAYGRGGNDYIQQINVPLQAEFYGEGDHDYLTGYLADDILIGGTGNDRLLAGEGNNRVWGDNDGPETGLDGIDQITTGNGNDIVYGGGGRDTINLGGGNDYAYGGSGDDQMDGQLGDDRLYGGLGADVISGSAGNDLIAGNEGNDRLYGKQGNDVVIGGDGADTVSGDEGNDLLFHNQAGITAPMAGNDASTTSGDANDLAMAQLLADWAADSVLNLVTLDAALAAADDGDIDNLFGGLGTDTGYRKGANPNKDNVSDLENQLP